MPWLRGHQGIINHVDWPNLTSTQDPGMPLKKVSVTDNFLNRHDKTEGLVVTVHPVLTWWCLGSTVTRASSAMMLTDPIWLQPCILVCHSRKFEWLIISWIDMTRQKVSLLPSIRSQPKHVFPTAIPQRVPWNYLGAISQILYEHIIQIL